jgi:hypothetical protein
MTTTVEATEPTSEKIVTVHFSDGTSEDWTVQAETPEDAIETAYELVLDEWPPVRVECEGIVEIPTYVWENWPGQGGILVQVAP